MVASGSAQGLDLSGKTIRLFQKRAGCLLRLLFLHILRSRETNIFWGRPWEGMLEPVNKRKGLGVFCVVPRAWADRMIS